MNKHGNMTAIKINTTLTKLQYIYSLASATHYACLNQDAVKHGRGNTQIKGRATCDAP